MENAQEALNTLLGRLNDWRQWEKAGYNHDLLKGAIAVIKVLRERVETARLEVEQCHAKAICMCGDYVKWHGGDDNHTPVSMYDYALDGANARAEAAEARVAEHDTFELTEKGHAYLMNYYLCHWHDGSDNDHTVIKQGQAAVELWMQECLLAGDIGCPEWIVDQLTTLDNDAGHGWTPIQIIWQGNDCSYAITEITDLGACQ